MRCGSLCLVLLLPAAGLLCADEPSPIPESWKVFTSKSGAYRVTLPDAPKQMTLPVQKGTAVTNYHAASSTDGRVTFLVVWSKLSPADNTRPAKAYFDAVERRASKASAAKIVSSADDEDGRRFLLADEAGLHNRSRLVRQNGRLYHVSVVGDAESVQTPRASAVLDSFTALDPKIK